MQWKGRGQWRDWIEVEGLDCSGGAGFAVDGLELQWRGRGWICRNSRGEGLDLQGERLGHAGYSKGRGWSRPAGGGVLTTGICRLLCIILMVLDSVARWSENILHKKHHQHNIMTCKHAWGGGGGGV